MVIMARSRFALVRVLLAACAASPRAPAPVAPPPAPSPAPPPRAAAPVEKPLLPRLPREVRPVRYSLALAMVPTAPRFEGEPVGEMICRSGRPRKYRSGAAEVR